MRVPTIALILLMTPALAGCLDGNLGICIGPEEPGKILKDTACTKWVIEVDHVAGMAPSAEALQLLKSRMGELVHKDSITIKVDDTNLAGRDVWTSAQLRDLEAQTRDEQTGGSTITTHVLYVDGELENPNSDGDVLAFASGSRYVVMFKDVIVSNTDGNFLVRTTAKEMENAVLVHEFGHVIGLVNNGITMQTAREDASHRGHSTNQNSVMYWAVESTDYFDLFADTAPPTTFDANDKKDIACAGGKGSC